MRTRDEHKEQLIRRKPSRLIVKNGLDGFAMNKVAKAAGCPPATLYIYLRIKDDFITRLSLDTAQKMITYSFEKILMQGCPLRPAANSMAKPLVLSHPKHPGNGIFRDHAAHQLL